MKVRCPISLVDTLRDLIRINSVNAFYDGGPGEAGVATYIQNYFGAHGIETWYQAILPATEHCGPRSNLIARIAGKDPSRRIVLEAHMDTVSIQGMTIPPFDPVVKDGRMYGRGSCDTKAGLAAMMHAIKDVHQSGNAPACEVWLAAVVDEEFSFRGALGFVEEYRADAVIVAEPTELRLVTASKGVLRWRIKVRGKSAHSSRCHLGVNAITHMARIVLAFEEEQSRLTQYGHPLLGPPSVNVGKIQGGVQVNFVPDECVIEIDRRLLPSEPVETVWTYYEQLLDRLRVSHADLNVQMEPPLLVDPAWSVVPSESIVITAADVLRRMECNPEPTGVPFGSDASKFGRAGIPTIIFGPGSIDQAHAAVEYVDLKQVEQASQFYREFLLSFE